VQANAYNWLQITAVAKSRCARSSLLMTLKPPTTEASHFKEQGKYQNASPRWPEGCCGNCVRQFNSSPAETEKKARTRLQPVGAAMATANDVNKEKPDAHDA